MKLEIIDKKIYYITFENSYLLTSTFLRLQEYYESPFKEIRRKYFTLSQFKKIYSKFKGGKFTYYEDWAGFNIPSHIVRKFFSQFTDLSPKEQKLKTSYNQH